MGRWSSLWHIRLGSPPVFMDITGIREDRRDTYDLNDPATIAKITLGATPWSNSEHAVHCAYAGRSGIGHLELVATPPLARWGITRNAS